MVFLPVWPVESCKVLTAIQSRLEHCYLKVSMNMANFVGTKPSVTFQPSRGPVEGLLTTQPKVQNNSALVGCQNQESPCFLHSMFSPFFHFEANNLFSLTSLCSLKEKLNPFLPPKNSYRCLLKHKLNLKCFVGKCVSFLSSSKYNFAVKQCLIFLKKKSDLLFGPCKNKTGLRPVLFVTLVNLVLAI